MEGYYVGGGDAPFRKVGAPSEERLRRVEHRLAKLERFITKALSAELRPSKQRPGPEHEWTTGKKSKD